jgi:hypothetical protein
MSTNAIVPQSTLDFSQVTFGDVRLNKAWRQEHPYQVQRSEPPDPARKGNLTQWE